MIPRSLLSWRRFVPLTIAIIVLAIITGIQTANSFQPTQFKNQWTPLVVSTLMPKTDAVLGVDGRYHVVYELELSNSNRTTATLKTIEVLDASAASVSSLLMQAGTCWGDCELWEIQQPVAQILSLMRHDCF